MTASQRSIHPNEVEDVSFVAVLDIRPHASSTPTLVDAAVAPADLLLSDPAQFIDDFSSQVLVVCDVGVRSDLISTQLRLRGYTHVRSLEGGIAAWIESGHATREPGGLTSGEFTRYDRQLKLPGFGIPAQQAIRDARVAVIGVGGLGIPVLSYLAGAGVGHITVIDSDRVEVSNLHRQPMFTMADVGSPKAAAAAAHASALNPTIEINAVAERIDDTNASEILSGQDLVVTCTDSFETAHAINRAAVRLGIPMIFGSVYRTEGQLAVFNASGGPCYACVFPPSQGAAGLDCSIVGVLGPVTGVVGSLQAIEALKVITGIGEALSGSLKLYDADTETIESLTVRKNPHCETCGNP